MATRGTAGYTLLRLNAMETTSGSGSKLLLDLQLKGSSKAISNNAGDLTAHTWSSS
jgi:hypothetical protein